MQCTRECTQQRIMITLLLITVIVLCLIHLLFNHNEAARIVKQMPGPRDYFIVGNAPIILVSPVELFRLTRLYANKFTGIYRFWAFQVGSINVYNPEDIEILTATMAHSEKSFVYKFLKPWLQDGLLLSKGEKWQERRKILTPAFHFNILRQFCVILEENSRTLTAFLKEKHVDQSVDIIPLLSDYTLSSICETAMGTHLDDGTDGSGSSYKNAIHELAKLLVERFTKVLYYSDFLFKFSSIARRQTTYLDILHSFTGNVIAAKKEFVKQHGVNVIDENIDEINMSGKKRRAAMLDLLISAESDGLINDSGIQEEVDTFMFEGHDTTAAGLTYCLLLLANHENIQKKISEELSDIFGKSSRPASIEDLSRMRYLECCIKESMRLYPPVPFISRNTTEATMLSNKYKLPPGSLCHIHIYDLHRREDLFKDPLSFDPDRFLPENCVHRHPYSYIPFSAGPRNCIGQKFAMLEMKSCISNILRNFDLLPVTTEGELEFKSDLVLRSTKPIYVRFQTKHIENN